MVTSPAFSINNVSIQEGNSGTTNAVFTVTLSTPMTTTATVKYATVNGTATAGSDYAATSGTLTFSAGQTSKTITVVIKGDTSVEPNETFAVQLSSPTKAILANATGTCTILNDDGTTAATTGVLSIGDTSVVNVKSGATSAVFTVSLSAALSSVVTVNYATADGTAWAGTDYNSTSGQLTFSAGQTSQTITVAIIGTTLSELAKTFQVTLSSPVNATLNRSQAVCTIDNTNLIGSNAGYDAVVYPYDPTVLTGSTPGVTTLIHSGDNVDTKLSLGTNKFNFYGTTYTSIYVSSNGLVTFGSGTTAANNTNLASSPTQEAIAPLWDNWVSTNGFPMVLSLLQDTNGDGVPDRLIIEWNNIQYSGGSPWTQTFQVDLQLNTGSTPGDIDLNYYFLDSQDSHAHGATATVGIKGPGSELMLLSFNNANNAYLTSYSAIRITQQNPFRVELGLRLQHRRQLPLHEFGRLQSTCFRAWPSNASRQFERSGEWKRSVSADRSLLQMPLKTTKTESPPSSTAIQGKFVRNAGDLAIVWQASIPCRKRQISLTICSLTNKSAITICPSGLPGNISSPRIRGFTTTPVCRMTTACPGSIKRSDHCDNWVRSRQYGD